MNRFKLVLIIALFALAQLVYAQVPIQITELTPVDDELGYSPDTLKSWVVNILRGRGGMIDTSTITFTGNYQALGRFYDGADIGFDKGLIISNGRVENAMAPNGTGSMSDIFNEVNPLSPSGDLDLLGMYNTIFGAMGGKDTLIHYTGDAAALEFVYIPFGDQLTMDYVFASEEYPSTSFQTGPADQDMTDFPNTPQIFDLFAISIENNPSFRNRAFTDPTLIGGGPPEPQRWVTVQHINENSSSSYFQPNPNAPPLGLALGTQFDGLTKTVGDLGPLLIKRNDAIPCGRYNVKIVIEDFLWISPDTSQTPDGYQINSAVFLNKNSLRSNLQVTNTEFSDWSVEYHFTNNLFEGDLIENCNQIIATFTLDDPINIDYSIPFKIELPEFRNRVEVAYDGGDVITNDSITFLAGETEKVIVISAINLDADYPNITFMYPENPCDWPGPFGGGYMGRIHFNLRNNEPISFTVNPKEYEAYCKETIELTITDITQNGVTPLYYYWDGDLVSNEIINYQVQSSPDLVPVLVKDGCGNESNAQVKINNKPIILEPILDAFLCGPGQSVTVPVTTQNPNYSDYTIDNVKWWKVSPYLDLGNVPGNEILVLYDNAVGADIWTCGFEITDCCGGTTIGTFLVNQSELTLGSDVTICNGEDKTLVANAMAQSYSWFATNDPGTILSTTNSVTVSPSVTTEYTLRIMDLCDVVQEATITVNVDLFVPQITIDPVSAEICPSETIVLTANLALEWNWMPGGETTQSITLNPTIPNTYLYTLTASSEFCFDKIATASFEVFPTPVAEFSFAPDDDACTGEPITFSYADIVTNETFEWTFGDGSSINNQPNPTHTYVNSGTYTVLLHVDKYICENDTTMELIINPLPSPDFDASVFEGCLPVDVNFDDLSNDVTLGANYEWVFGDGATSDDDGNTSHTYTEAGIFDVSLTISNTQRCAEIIIKPNLIQANPNPDADFDAEPHITTLDTPTIEFSDLSLSDSTISDYEWIFGDGESNYDNGNTSHTYTQAGDYTVEMYIETINGCVDSTSIQVALTEEVRLFIPNAFTPNNDGVNDVFEIKGTPIADFNLYIFDRWGAIIWSTHNYEVHWDGKTKEGNLVPSGTYVYQISGTDYRHQVINYKGMVTVVR
ncbi:MAG: PKD domain-containing protein, partial [Bacteroidota bacterium]